MISTIFSFISLILTAYSFIIFIRIIFSWFTLRNNNNGVPQNKITNFLYQITDPYLNWFRRFKFTQIGMMDFSAILGIFVIYFLSNITSRIALTGTITLTFLIKLIITSLWSLASSLVTIIIIIFLIRLVFILINKPSIIFQSMDGYVEPFVRKFSNIFTKRFTPYKVNLVIFILSLFILRFGVAFLLNIILGLF